MPWFKVDDLFGTHMKAVTAGNAACGLWVRAGSWSAAQLTDGHIPAAMVGVLGGRAADARKLVEVGLWHDAGHDCDVCPQPTGRGAHVFHRWSDFQPVKADVEQKRSDARDRMRRHRSGSADVRANTPRTSAAVTPTPTRPDPTPAAAAADERSGGGLDLPDDLAVLRSRMGTYTALAALRWDTLRAEQVVEIQELIARHGDQALVDCALRTCKVTPPVFITAFVPTWRALGELRSVTTTPAETCDVCGRSRHACEQAARTVDADDRHDFTRRTA